MRRVVFDTFTWIEYLKDSEHADKIESYFQDEIYTPLIVLFELSCKSAREGWDFKHIMGFIKSKSKATGSDEELIINSGKTWVEMRKIQPRFSLADSIILSTARRLNAKVLTGDKHFKNLPEAVML